MDGVLPKLVFFGSDAICLPVLDYLLDEAASACELHAVVSQPDRAKGRGRKLQPNPVAAWARAAGVELLQPERPGADLAEWIRTHDVAVTLVMAYGEFLPGALRHAAGHEMLNFHGSILPRYRGASPVETAVAMGDHETGISLMRVDAEMDAGGVADVERIRIENTNTAGRVREKMGFAAVPLLRRNLEAILQGGLVFEEQDPEQASYCRKLVKGDGAIDFSLAAKAVYDRIRAFDPWPGSYFEHAGDRIKVGAARLMPGSVGAAPGSVLSTGDGLEVACGEGVVIFGELQRPGGRMLPATEFLRGYPLEAGRLLESVRAEPLVTGYQP